MTDNQLSILQSGIWLMQSLYENAELQPEESAALKALEICLRAFIPLYEQKKYEECFQCYFMLAEPMEAFMDKCHINHEDPEIALRRQSILRIFDVLMNVIVPLYKGIGNDRKTTHQK